VKSEIGIDVDAAPALVFALARDVERWSILLPHYARSRVVGHDVSGRPLVQFVARRPLVPILGFGLPVVWASRTWNDPEAKRLYFEHVAGATRGMHVVWRFETRGAGGARVTISHDFAPRMPGFAPFVDRFFTRPIAGRTLATFKALAEAVNDVEDSATSDGPLTTNPSS
jgi:ribosome-associated toxin RatA of RatAB toxin-antitoxin module